MIREKQKKYIKIDNNLELLTFSIFIKISTKNNNKHPSSINNNLIKKNNKNRKIKLMIQMIVNSN